MKKSILLTVILLAVLIFPVQAQASAQIVGSTVAIPSELVTPLESYLSSAQPAPVQYYAITYIQPKGEDYFVSLVGLDLTDPNESWSLEDGKAVWMGTVYMSLTANGFQVEMYSATARELSTPKSSSTQPSRRRLLRPIPVAGWAGNDVWSARCTW